MASRHREFKIITSTTCPRCGAKEGEKCKRADGVPLPGAHIQRRRAWQERSEKPKPCGWDRKPPGSGSPLL